MKVQNELKLYDDFSGEGIEQTIAVESHGIHNDRIVLVIGKSRYVVIADQLARAIRNATNHR